MYKELGINDEDLINKILEDPWYYQKIINIVKVLLKIRSQFISDQALLRFIQEALDLDPSCHFRGQRETRELVYDLISRILNK